MAETIYQMLKVLSFCDRERTERAYPLSIKIIVLTFLVKNEKRRFSWCLVLENIRTEKKNSSQISSSNLKVSTVSSRSRGRTRGPLFLEQTEARRIEKISFGDRAPRLISRPGSGIDCYDVPRQQKAFKEITSNFVLSPLYLFDPSRSPLHTYFCNIL